MPDSSSIWVELARQVPALVIFAIYSFYVHKHYTAEAEKSEKRLVTANEREVARLKEVIDQQNKTLGVTNENTATSNEVIGSMKTLLTFAVEKDLKALRDASRQSKS